jgi:signal transduction histidine kinase
VILTSAALLGRSGKLEEKQQLLLHRVMNNARRIERMVHDLLDYTRTRQGRAIPIVPRDTDVLALCHQVIDGMQLVHPSRPLRLTAQGQTHARVDPDRATQVLANLVSNALYYGSPGTPVDVTLRDQDGALELSVHNQGPPIPADLRGRLFDAFQRGVPDQSRHRDGLGLGLYIVRQIVEAHGGSVDVRSDEASGTTFSVRWPR